MNFLFSIQSVINTLTWLMHILCDICVPYYIYIFSRWFLSLSLLISHRIASCAHIFYADLLFENCIRRRRKCTHWGCMRLIERQKCMSAHDRVWEKWDKRTKDIIESISIYRLGWWWLLFSIGIRSRIERERERKKLYAQN